MKSLIVTKMEILDKFDSNYDELFSDDEAEFMNNVEDFYKPDNLFVGEKVLIFPLHNSNVQNNFWFVKKL